MNDKTPNHDEIERLKAEDRVEFFRELALLLRRHKVRLLSQQYAPYHAVMEFSDFPVEFGLLHYDNIPSLAPFVIETITKQTVDFFGREEKENE